MDSTYWEARANKTQDPTADILRGRNFVLVMQFRFLFTYITPFFGAVAGHASVCTWIQHGDCVYR